MTFLCEYCYNIYNSKYLLSRHQNSESCKKIQNIIINYNNKNNEKLKEIQTEYSDKIKLLENELFQIKQENTLLKNENKLLEKSNESFRKIVEKAALKTTNTVKNYNHNNYLNYISTEPLKISELPKQLKNIVNCDTMMYDDEDFHEHIVDNILRDKSGNDKVLCTDINRKNFTYKDEKSGELISDPELERLREQLKKGTDIKQIRKDLLEKLVTEYEENNCTGTDPYKIFSETIQKLNFGTPFVEHVAKKTYIKSKNKLDILEIQESFDKSLNDDFYDEEEYNRLLKEFGNDNL
jgi:hypothetical protein